MLFKLSNLNPNLALTLGYLNPVLNNSALSDIFAYCSAHNNKFPTLRVINELKKVMHWPI